jgi:uncharacterized protein
VQTTLADAEEADTGPKAVRSETERLCVVTRTVKPIDELIRFVVAPDGSVVADLKRRLPGRGVWITGTHAALTTAVQRKLFTRAFKRDVRAAPDLVGLVERLLERAALDALSMVHKSGLLVSGYAKVEAAVLGKAVVALLHASDAGADGARKLAAAAARRWGAGVDGPSRIVAFTGAQLDLALGRSNVVHAAVLAGPASDGFLARCRSLERFRSGEGSSGGVPARGGGAMTEEKVTAAAKAYMLKPTAGRDA